MTDSDTATADSCWEMHAVAADDGTYVGIGSLTYAAVFGPNPRRVTVERTDDGPYWGWIRDGHTHPSMIRPREILFRAQFTAPPEDEEARGKGTVVRLDVTEEPT